MKYINFKSFKFSTIVKNFNNIRYYSVKIFRIVDPRRYIVDPRRYIAGPRRYIVKKFYKFADFSRLVNFIRFANFRRFRFYRVDKLINLKKYKNYPYYFIGVLLFSGFIYLIIPTFYNYDKSKFEKTICANKNVQCIIKGKIHYSFFPTPRIKINDLIVNKLNKNEKNWIKVKKTSIKISIFNLFYKEKQQFKKVEFKDYEINLNFNDLVFYKKFFKEKLKFIPITFKDGKVIFFDNKNYISTIDKAQINFKSKAKFTKGVLKGNFLNDDIYINFTSEEKNNQDLIEAVLKMSNMNLYAKTQFFLEKNKNGIKGNILIKENKKNLTGLFHYKDNLLTINKSNVSNSFLEGKLSGKVNFSPYFNFDLDLNLNNINFTKLHSNFVSLDTNGKNSFFRINKKINGKLNFSSDKVYSGNNLVKSFESRLKFNNGSIFVEQFLLNLGKLGAADFLGEINNDKQSPNFKFESNIFVDNQKKFLSKFGIYNRNEIPSNFFVSGNIDLENLRIFLYEISDQEKLKNDDINFIEKEFNDYMFEDGYESLFNFSKFKEFVKSITTEVN